MIVDNIKNAEFYYKLSPRIEAAFRFLKEQDCSRLEPGKYDILGDDCYASVDRYNTKPKESGIWEAHRRYIDVQYIVSGEEIIGCTQLSALKPIADYDEIKDIIFLKGKGNFVSFKAGMFAVFAPWDAHMPCLAATAPSPVHKIVVKVLA